MGIKHTPGPWVVGSHDFLDQWVCIDAPSGDHDLDYKSWEGVAMAYGCEDSPFKGLEKAKANAMLIAAAPELLEALESVLENCLDSDGLAAAYEKARAAIAKAKGEGQ